MNTEFGLCYNRIQKNANSTTVLLMDSISGGNHDAKQAKKAVASISDLGRVDIARLNDFWFFVVVRNPYSRTLSAFLQKFANEENRQQYGDFPLNPDGFRDFVRWLDNGGMAKNSHWDLQQKQMCFEASDYDTVIRFENYNAEMRAFLERSGVPASRIYLDDSAAKGTHHKTGASDRLRQFYDAETQSIVQRRFMNDFLSLGYDPDRLD
uniref:sulfotransferase family 2 domain-containing protein n=1 Tax=Pararhizobium sp. IMCC3301 TaxID=3067904 RepID=UPI0027418E56|nr:sulfotransferase family 2 domain-containing protein [Pararhizobium sp. IMCC3301]